MKSFQTFLATQLNKEQLTAVTTNHPATMVIAGAGSGKTRVITARIAHLILSLDANPASIVALTFTNKAAGEMKERLTNFLGADSPLPFIGTFHSYCLLLLRKNPGLLPFPSFSILDADDQLSLLKKIIKRNNLDKQITASSMSHQISMAKNKLLFDENVDTFAKPLFKEIYLTYESEKAASHSLDFDDLLVQTLTAFQTNPDFTRDFQQRVDHILVDEYQDTSFVQHALLKSMSMTPLDQRNKKKKRKLEIGSICAVGDEDQSIYSWRGAQVTNMLTFQSDFAPVHVTKIEQNYRSVQPILRAANAVISNNSERHEKKLWSEKKATGRIMITQCQSGYQEADALVSALELLQTKKKLCEVAILYRTHFQSRSLEEAFLRSSIPYHIVGGVRFYERKEIKDILAYMRLIANPFDRTSLFRIINYPTRGLGPKFEEDLYFTWQQQPMLNFKQVLAFMLSAEAENPLRGTKAATVQTFLDMFAGLDVDQKPSVIITLLLERTDYVNFMRKTLDPKQADTKQENVREFVQSIQHFEQTAASDEVTLQDFLHEIALMQEKMEKEENHDNQVRLMTLHAVKGLEFDTVFIVGLEEGLLPSNRSLHSSSALEEERRLFYVGMTRAKERLLLTHANYRNTYGTVSDQLMSRFVSEIPSNLITQIDMSETTRSAYNRLMADWLGIQGQFASSRNQGTMKTYGNAQPSHRVKVANASVRTRKSLLKKADSMLSKPTGDTPWKKNQLVMHTTFGPGMVKKVEKKSGDFYLTVLFRVGEKKIHSKFVKAA